MFRFVEADTEELLDKVFRFRCKIMCEEKKFLDINDFPDKKERDKYDEYAIQFAALDENDEVCACVRLIHHSPIGYPTENNLEFDKEKYKFDREKLCEVSRIFIDKKYRNMKDTKVLMEFVKKYVYFKMKDFGIEYSYGALENNFIKLLNIFKIPYKKIGIGKEFYSVLRYPCIMYVEDLENINPGLLEEWERQRDVLKV
ncbi:GNAT family N-acyltransferase [Nitrosophilus alvini]|uniref:GNAT family N-acyltransferase n=1 Tax=Nitrosophilus alvini TaxID=2714855 RepID=UPI00190A0046|nr:GNAT family N-acyltransferase [Nitrosophilus alvini]